MQITEFARETQSTKACSKGNQKNVGEVFVSEVVLGTTAFALKEIFQIIHDSSLFV